MICATYKRRGRRYRYQRIADKAVSLSIAQISLLRRAGIRLLGIIVSTGETLRVHARNAVGVVDYAEFPADRADAAKAFVYGAARNHSPQLSLFQGVL
ncbi:hypothetical protein A3Q32_12415 [Alcanivorax sp. KX64203]|nr:hypothetical protein A3Q32_12415 [Alcanivorax sp. KX64203]